MAAPECGRAPARAALAGNPSDAYGGAVLAVTVENWSAVARPHDAVVPPSRLVEAAVRRFAGELDVAARGARWSTSIPIEVGLGGSSALVIATLRALCAAHHVTLEAGRLAAMALAVEVDDLGISAGPQDRLVQAHGGLILMDFASGNPVQPLDRALLPPLVVAYREDSGGPSGGVHGGLRRRFDCGEAVVVAAMHELADLARSARAAVLASDADEFGRCVDRSFDLRRSLVDLDDRCVAMIDAARRAGAAANYTGSGGAVIAVCRDDRDQAGVVEALRAAGAVAERVNS